MTKYTVLAFFFSIFILSCWCCSTRVKGQKNIWHLAAACLLHADAGIGVWTRGSGCLLLVVATCDTESSDVGTEYYVQYTLIFSQIICIILKHT
jgi:hypothetical protein